MSVRVRFAPSPTGFLHIGGARTALFNWLFARQRKGTFILRIEDTDQDRNVAEAVGPILHSLNWLGLNWDKGPSLMSDERGDPTGDYFQSHRYNKGVYKKHINRLLEVNKAYSCYCTAEDVQAMREKALAEKRNPRYDGTCRNLSLSERKSREAEGRPGCVRYKLNPAGRTEYHDLMKGLLGVENSQLEDFVIQRSSGFPTYNFACVVDDYEMEITHVLRGDDHVSNTPRQLLLYQALSWEPPRFGHMSMILAADGTRLSKRRHAVAVDNYEANGYLPGALVNYLALLGWSTEDSQQIFRLEELIEKFSVERCVKSPAVFDQDKLLWMCGEYMRKMPVSEILHRATPFLQSAGIPVEDPPDRRKRLEAVIELERDKFKLLTDVPARVDIFFKDIEYDNESVEKVLRKPDVPAILETCIKEFEKLESFTAVPTEEACRNLAHEKGLKAAAVFHPVRVAVSGRTQGPSLFHMLEILGKQECLDRMRKTIRKFFAST